MGKCNINLKGKIKIVSIKYYLYKIENVYQMLKYSYKTIKREKKMKLKIYFKRKGEIEKK